MRRTSMNGPTDTTRPVIAVSRPRLRDGALDDEIVDQGFVVISGAARSAVRDLRRIHRRVVGRVPTGFDSTLYSPDTDHKRRVDTELRAAMIPILDALLTDHQPLLANFVTKGRSTGGTMPPHQDWTFVDERTSASWNVWIPLVDVDHRNGAMSVLPRGHRVPFTLRGTDTDNPFAAIEAEAADRMVELRMRAGDVLVHDHRVLHSSPPNLRRRPRIVAGCAVIPAGVSPIHYRQSAPTTMERYDITPRFFTEHTFGATGFPDGTVLTETFDFGNPRLAVADLPPAD